MQETKEYEYRGKTFTVTKTGASIQVMHEHTTGTISVLHSSKSGSGLKGKFLITGDDFKAKAVSIEEAMETVCGWILHTVELRSKNRLRVIEEGATTATKYNELMGFFDAIP